MGWRGSKRRKSSWSLSDEEVFGQLEKPGISDTTFLWRYSEQQLLDRLDQVRILARVNELGYPAPRLAVGTAEGLHLLRLEVEGEEAPLMDLRLSEEARVLSGFAERKLGSGTLALLVIQWVSLQHVRGSFTSERPRLPGQSYPGLGVGRKLYRVLWVLARELGKDALSAFPMYFHNAVYYAGGFHYLDPQKQAELVALRRDLAHLPLNVASEGVSEGRLTDGASGEAVDWNPGEMLAPISRRLRSYFTGRDYSDEVDRAQSRLSYRLARSPR